MSVVVIGETMINLLWDVKTGRVESTLGGSPAKVALCLHTLGRKVTLITCWGDDQAGQLVQNYLSASQVAVRRVPSSSSRTMVGLAYADGAGPHPAHYQLMSAWDPLELPLDHNITLLHTGSLAGVLEPGVSRVLEACWRMSTRPGAAVSVNLSTHPFRLPTTQSHLDAAMRLALLADVVTVSDHDLKLLFPDQQPLESARDLLGLGPQLVVVMCGASASFAVTRDHEVHAEATRPSDVDAVAAQDAFQARLLDVLLGAAGGASVRIPNAFTTLKEMLHRCLAAGAEQGEPTR
ncbi:carbohydrate kinase family protein [Streptomyces sp. NPDC008343]|uniref:carbohydrate kinase family protein n=1 Tax=Streptomyces sp. NPDC008343 TaxID=3364828 RepID=UPI0036E29B7A